jgi:hypothetical protein
MRSPAGRHEVADDVYLQRLVQGCDGGYRAGCGHPVLDHLQLHFGADLYATQGGQGDHLCERGRAVTASVVRRVCRPPLVMTLTWVVSEATTRIRWTRWPPLAKDPSIARVMRCRQSTEPACGAGGAGG